MGSTHTRVLANFVGGRFASADASGRLDVRDPATQELLARVPLSTTAEVDKAVRAARAAFPSWRATPAAERARALRALRDLLEKNLQELMKLVARDQGRSLDQAHGDVARALGCIESACALPTADEAPETDIASCREPVGVFAVIASARFPALASLWSLPYAVALGNTVVCKPDERTPLAHDLLAHLLDRVALPHGVVNVVHGAHDVVNGLVAHPLVDGVSFAGSMSVARHVHALGAQHGKRVASHATAKTVVTVLPDGDLARAARDVWDADHGALVLCVGDAYAALKTRLLDAPAAPVSLVSKKLRAQLHGSIQRGRDEGAELLRDGRAEGDVVGPTVLDRVRPSMAVARDEVFGPVACVMEAPSLDDALAALDALPRAGGASVYTADRAAARAFTRRVRAARVGVNVGVASALTTHRERDAHARAHTEFFTDDKVTISRWW